MTTIKLKKNDNKQILNIIVTLFFVSKKVSPVKGGVKILRITFTPQFQSETAAYFISMQFF